MAEADKPLGSAERKDRCARVAASVAYRTVELLNAWKDGTYVTTGAIPGDEVRDPGPAQLHRLPRQDVPTPPVASCRVAEWHGRK